MTTKATTLPADLRAVQQRFDAWRRKRPRICAIPDALWGAALSVYPRYSLHRISAACHLDSSALKQRLIGPRPQTAGKRPRQQRFVEVGVPRGMGGTEYILEVTEREGRTLRVRMSGVEAVVEVLRRLRGESA